MSAACKNLHNHTYPHAQSVHHQENETEPQRFNSSFLDSPGEAASKHDERKHVTRAYIALKIIFLAAL